MVVSRVIDTGLILAVLYLILSVVVSHFSEQIAAVLHWRGKTLYKGVLELLSGDDGLTQAVFEHPLVAASGPRPSYLDARNFSLALWQSIAVAQKAQGPGSTLSYDLGNAGTPPLTTAGTLQLQVAQLPHANLRSSLYALLGQAQGDYQALLAATDAWFNRQMDRVSGGYRRKTQFVIVVVSVILVALLGVDSIKILSRLYVDDQVRFALAASVATNAASPPPAVASSDTPPLTYNEQLSLLSALDDPRFVQTIVSGPIGLSPDDKNAESRSAADETTHILGVVITIIIVSLGAPFWFDVFKLFMNVRLAGPKPQTPNGNGSKQSSSS
jgi:hypothetical protein